MNMEYEPAYVIIRSDDFLGDDAPSEEKITVKLIVWSREEAIREVDRLNALGNRARYFWQATRLKKASSAAPTAVSGSGPSIVTFNLAELVSQQYRKAAIVPEKKPVGDWITFPRVATTPAITG
jgi:hypothetical protein